MHYTEYDTRFAAYAVVTDDAGRVLLALWNEGARRQWTLPGGGVELHERAEEGVVREVVYLGAATSRVVELDDGPLVTVSHPNTDTSIDAAAERRDQRVVVTWRRDHLVSLGSPALATSPEEETA